MYDLNYNFKLLFSQYAKNTGLNHGETKDSRGVDDFLIDANEKGWGPKEFVAELFLQCCERDGSHADQVICMVGVELLREAFDSPVPDQDAERLRQGRDCYDAIKTGSREQILRWANSWF